MDSLVDRAQGLYSQIQGKLEADPLLFGHYYLGEHFRDVSPGFHRLIMDGLMDDLVGYVEWLIETGGGVQI